ncbi:MAG TPA: SEC-C domain-containing protein [Bacillota bacterium]|nr:SEC-C domain-containing protein [Bacillota bacterium]
MEIQKNKSIVDELWTQTQDETVSAVLGEHPEVDALWRRLDMLSGTVDINGVNPVLHILFECIVERQIREENPPEAREAVERLQQAGLSRHAARSTVVALFIHHFYEVIKQQVPFDTVAYTRRLRLLGREAGGISRNDPCPCGSGKKYKKCCIEVEDCFKLNRSGGFLLLGWGAYATRDYLLQQATDAPVVQLENRHHIARYLAEKGDLEGSLAALEDNVKLAEAVGKQGFLENALHDVEELCLNNKDLAAEGIRVEERLLELAKDDDEKGFCYCNRADFLATMGRVEEGEEEYRSLFARMPDWHFGRYRYALFLEQLGRKGEAVKVLRSLVAARGKIDRETYRAAADALAGMERNNNTQIY